MNNSAVIDAVESITAQANQWQEIFVAPAVSRLTRVSFSLSIPEKKGSLQIIDPIHPLIMYYLTVYMV